MSSLAGMPSSNMYEETNWIALPRLHSISTRKLTCCPIAIFGGRVQVKSFWRNCYQSNTIEVKRGWSPSPCSRFNVLPSYISLWSSAFKRTCFAIFILGPVQVFWNTWHRTEVRHRSIGTYDYTILWKIYQSVYTSRFPVPGRCTRFLKLLSQVKQSPSHYLFSNVRGSWFPFSRPCRCFETCDTGLRSVTGQISIFETSRVLRSNRYGKCWVWQECLHRTCTCY